MILCPIDLLQPSYCCYVRQAMLLSHYTCSHAVKNTSLSKEETDNTPTDKKEQVAFGMKQSLSFKIVVF